MDGLPFNAPLAPAGVLSPEERQGKGSISSAKGVVNRSMCGLQPCALIGCGSQWRVTTEMIVISVLHKPLLRTIMTAS